jgi:hypothetical protein
VLDPRTATDTVSDQAELLRTVPSPKSSEVQGKEQDHRGRIPRIILPFEPRVSIYYLFRYEIRT